jgi:hypothetical protein
MGDDLEDLKNEILTEKKRKPYTKSDRAKQTMLQNLAKGRAVREQKMKEKKAGKGKKTKFKEESDSDDSESDDDFVITKKKAKKKQKGGDDPVHAKLDDLTKIMTYLAKQTKKVAKKKKPKDTIVQVMQQPAPQVQAPAKVPEVDQLQKQLLSILKY